MSDTTRGITGITDEMVEAAVRALHQQPAFVRTETVRAALEAALDAAEIVSVEASGPKVWACRDEQGWFVVHRSDCRAVACAGPHMMLTLGRQPFGAEQPQEASDE